MGQPATREGHFFAFLSSGAPQSQSSSCQHRRPRSNFPTACVLLHCSSLAPSLASGLATLERADTLGRHLMLLVPLPGMLPILPPRATILQCRTNCSAALT